MSSPFLPARVVARWGAHLSRMRPPLFFSYPLDNTRVNVHTHVAWLFRTMKGDNMANGKTAQPTELTIEGVTLVFDGFEMPARTTGKGSSKNDTIIAAIRDNATPGKPVWMQGTKVSAVAGLKKKYPDIHFETRGGKENPSVYATVRETTEVLTSA